MVSLDRDGHTDRSYKEMKNLMTVRIRNVLVGSCDLAEKDIKASKTPYSGSSEEKAYETSNPPSILWFKGGGTCSAGHGHLGDLPKDRDLSFLHAFRSFSPSLLIGPEPGHSSYYFPRP